MKIFKNSRQWAEKPTKFLNKNVFFIFSILFLFACKESEVKLDSNEKYIVDTLAGKRMELVNQQLDAFWKVKNDSLVKFATDSMVEFQLKNIQERLKSKWQKK